MSIVTFVPQIIYNAGATTISLSLPMRLWDPSSLGVGGKNVSTAGAPEAFELRRDELVKVTIRFKETEWAVMRTFLVFQQQNPGSTFTFNFQTNPVIAAPSVVYLEKPAMGEAIAPKRGDAKGTFEIDLVLRSSTSTSLHVQAF